MTHHRLTPEQRQRRRDNGRLGALAKAEGYRTGRLKRRGLDKNTLKRRRYRQLRAEGRCVLCMEPSRRASHCKSCSDMRSLKRRERLA